MTTRRCVTHHEDGRRRALGLLMMTLVTAACASTAVTTPQPAGRSAAGTVSFDQIRDPQVEPPRANGRFEYLRPRLEEGFQMPRFPDAALAAGAPPTVIVVRAVVAEDGSVARVGQSPLAAPPGGEWDALFLEAVVESVSGWRYDPCQLRELEDGPDSNDDGAPDYQVVVASKPLSVYLDLAFRFEIVDGDGVVTTSREGG